MATQQRPIPADDIEAIESLARILRKALEINNRTAPNVLYLFEQLKRIFPKLQLRIVPDVYLKKPARSNPKKWTIRIRQSVYEALLRGQWLARWTLCHEIGHVLRAHPGMPFREELKEKRKGWKEREANIFARRLLIPPHLSVKCSTVEEISRLFQVSSEAAQIALLEQEREQLRLNSSLPSIRRAAIAAHARLDYISSIEDQAAATLCAIFQVVTEARALSVPAEPFRDCPLSTAILIAVGARLLCEAYGSFNRSIGAANFCGIASLAAAICYMRPLREIGNPDSRSSEMALLNQKCAASAVAKIMNTHRSASCALLPMPDDPILFESSYLNALQDIGTSQIQSDKTILSISELPEYGSYNDENDIAWCDIHYLERLMNAIERISLDI
jgi:Zn-dependent peptidase ImmA (M78 family)